MASALDIKTYGDMQLDAILALDEPERTKAVRAWIQAGEVLYEGEESLVKIVTSDGKRLPTEYRNRAGKQITVDSNGRKVSRRRAYDMLLKYGKNGVYTGTDQATGFTKLGWTQYVNKNPELAKVYGEPTFLTNYLTHKVEMPVDAGVPILSSPDDELE